MLLALAAVWGSSYLFIKLALEDLSPAAVVFGRLALAAVILLPFALSRGLLSGVSAAAPTVLVLALIQVALPFGLITYGELTISSSLAGILVSSAPIWTALLALRLDREEQSRGWRLVGVFVGIAGVALLLGVDLGGGGALLGGLAVVLAGVGYAIGGFMIKRRLGHIKPVGLVTATMAASALMALPFALLSAPDELPGAGAAAALVTLGVAGTGVAFVIFYTLIARVGPARASLVAYVAPIFAVLYGVSFLDESFSLGTFASLVLILGGSWLAAGGSLARLTPGRAAIASRR